jgi:hypothetical protein
LSQERSRAGYASLDFAPGVIDSRAVRGLVIAVVLLAGCAVQRPVAQPLAEARYYHAEVALARASDRIASTILARIPGNGPIVLALSPVFDERQVRIFRALLFAGLTAGRDVRLVPHARATGPANAGLPVVEIVLLAAGSELLADAPPGNEPVCATLHIAALVRVHERGALLWSDVLHEEESELPILAEESKSP